MMLVHLRIELFYEPYGNFIGTIIIVAVAREVVVCFEVDRNAVFGAMLFVIPGFPFITSGLDIAKMDMRSGLERLAHAIVIIGVATLVGWVTALVVHLQPENFMPLQLTVLQLMFLRVIASFCGVYGFSIMFNSPRKMAAIARHHQAIEIPHLFKFLIQPGELASDIYKKAGIDIVSFEKKIDDELDRIAVVEGTNAYGQSLSQNMYKLMQDAEMLRTEFSDEYVAIDTLLLAFVCDSLMI